MKITITLKDNPEIGPGTILLPYSNGIMEYPEYIVILHEDESESNLFKKQHIESIQIELPINLTL